MSSLQEAAPATVSTGYPTPESQVQFIIACSIVRDWGFSEVDFQKLGEPPPVKEGMAMVLDVQLDGPPRRTFEEAWDIIEGVYDKSRREDMISELRVREGVRHERGLYWRTLNLRANHGHMPGEINAIRTGAMPSSAVMWAVAYFPEWVRSVHAIYIPGYQASVSLGNTPRWGYMPKISWTEYSGIELGDEFVHEPQNSVTPTF